MRRRAGAARGFEFAPRVHQVREVPPVRWLVWWFEEAKWGCLADAMPQGAAYSYADAQRRYAGAIAMEAWPLVNEDDWLAWVRFIEGLKLDDNESMQLVYAALPAKTGGTAPPAPPRAPAPRQRPSRPS